MPGLSSELRPWHLYCRSAHQQAKPELVRDLFDWRRPWRQPIGLIHHLPRLDLGSVADADSPGRPNRSRRRVMPSGRHSCGLNGGAMNRGAVVVPGSLGLASARTARPLLADLLGRPSDRPGLVLALGGVAAGILMLLQAGDVAHLSWLTEGAHILVSSSCCLVALLIMARRPGPKILNYRPLAAASALCGLGLVGVELVPVVGTPATVAANTFIVLGVTIALSVVIPALYRPSDERARAAAILDSLIMTAAGTTLVVTVWRSGTSRQAGVDQFLVPALAACLLASTSMPVIAALSRRIALEPRGIWCAMFGSAVLAWCWILWIDTTLHGGPRTELVSLTYSSGILLIAWAWISWTDSPGRGRIYLAIAQRLTDWLPAAAIFLCLTITAIPHGDIGPIDPAYLGTVVVVLLTLARQRLLILNERFASRLLAREVEERTQTMLSLSRLEPGATLEATASRICSEAMRLDGIDGAAVYSFGPSESVVPLALWGNRRGDEAVREPVDAARALHLRSRAGGGTWVDAPRHGSATTADRAEAFAPMRWDDHIVGVVAMGAVGREQVLRLPERLSTLSEFGVVSAALMGPMLAEHWRMADLRSQLDEMITSRAFWPVFQAVVRLADRRAVGYEALTRFSDGMRPDVRFAQANAAGMSVRLETACMHAQLEAASWLPRDVWVSLNVSPALATAVVPLITAVELADRDVVFEITEHVEIGDYSALDRALDLVRGRVRLAVDDAGAGYAGLRHILELRPQFVKLDLSLVRNVDTDQARQAMVAGMAHFAHDSGCELIAEGIETEGEARELIRLGVTYGQGYLFGRPAPLN
jgi:EAL domain-containing protein (putative c-di-GMP-specific phosphodiesterase class I)